MRRASGGAGGSKRNGADVSGCWLKRGDASKSHTRIAKITGAGLATTLEVLLHFICSLTCFCGGCQFLRSVRDYRTFIPVIAVGSWRTVLPRAGSHNSPREESVNRHRLTILANYLLQCGSRELSALRIPASEVDKNGFDGLERPLSVRMLRRYPVRGENLPGSLPFLSRREV